MSKKNQKESELSQPWDYFPLFPVYAFTDLKKARKLVKKITGKRFEPVENKDGTFSLYEHEDKKHKFGVVFLDCENYEIKDKFAVLAHECIHYAQAFSDGASSTPLDDETFAYTAECAMLACIDQIGIDWFCENQKK